MRVHKNEQIRAEDLSQEEPAEERKRGLTEILLQELGGDKAKLKGRRG